MDIRSNFIFISAVKILHLASTFAVMFLSIKYAGDIIAYFSVNIFHYKSNYDDVVKFINYGWRDRSPLSIVLILLAVVIWLKFVAGPVCHLITKLRMSVLQEEDYASDIGLSHIGNGNFFRRSASQSALMTSRYMWISFLVPASIFLLYILHETGHFL